jgi:hypothetical protein
MLYNFTCNFRVSPVIICVRILVNPNYHWNKSDALLNQRWPSAHRDSWLQEQVAQDALAISPYQNQISKESQESKNSASVSLSTYLHNCHRL